MPATWSYRQQLPETPNNCGRAARNKSRVEHNGKRITVFRHQTTATPWGTKALIFLEARLGALEASKRVSEKKLQDKIQVLSDGIVSLKCGSACRESKRAGLLTTIGGSFLLLLLLAYMHTHTARGVIFSQGSVHGSIIASLVCSILGGEIPETWILVELAVKSFVARGLRKGDLLG
jgi:hypothetical protein